MAAPADARQVHETTMLYDVCRIGPSVENQDKNKWYPSFTALAADEKVPFLNVRNSSGATLAYCNISTTDKFPYPFVMESIGIRFTLPDPVLTDPSPAMRALSKLWAQVIPEHAYFKFIMREDVRFILKPKMMPAGYGTVGNAGVFIGFNAFSSVYENGNVNMGNRWTQITSPIDIPENTPVSGELWLSNYAKGLLTAIGAVPPLPLLAGEGYPNEALIELSIRGVRYTQQRGEYFAP